MTRQNIPMRMSDLRKLTSQTTVPNTTPIQLQVRDDTSRKLRLLDGEYRFHEDQGILILHLVVGEHAE